MVTKPEQYLAGAVHAYDQDEAAFRDSLTPEQREVLARTDWRDGAIETLRQLAQELEIAVRDPQVRAGVVLACRWLEHTADNHACCDNHAEYLDGVTQVLACSMAAERSYRRGAP